MFFFCGLLAVQEITDGANMFGGMGKVQNAHRVRTMIIGEGLQPLRAIHDRRDRPRVFHSAPMHFC